jgi:hypothetical protein
MQEWSDNVEKGDRLLIKVVERGLKVGFTTESEPQCMCGVYCLSIGMNKSITPRVRHRCIVAGNDRKVEAVGK